MVDGSHVPVHPGVTQGFFHQISVMLHTVSGEQYENVLAK